MPGGWEWLIIIAVLLLLFGAKRLPDMARSVGQSARVFKGEMKGLKDDEKKKQDEQAAAPVQPAEIPPAQPVNTAPVNGAAHANGTTPVNQPAAPQDARPAGQ